MLLDECAPRRLRRELLGHWNVGVRSCILYSPPALIVPMDHSSSPQRTMQGYTKNAVRREINQPERDALFVRAVHRDECSQREVADFLHLHYAQPVGKQTLIVGSRTGAVSRR